MSLIFIQDKVAKNNHLFSREKDLQLGSRPQEMIQFLVITVCCFCVRLLLKKELSKSFVHPCKQATHSPASVSGLKVGVGHGEKEKLKCHYQMLEMQIIPCWWGLFFAKKIKKKSRRDVRMGMAHWQSYLLYKHKGLSSIPDPALSLYVEAILVVVLHGIPDAT